MSPRNTQKHHFFSNSGLAQYLGLPCENPQVSLKTVKTLNLATFHPTEEGKPDYDCSKVTDKVYVSCPDLQDHAIKNPELTLFSGGSSYLQESTKKRFIQSPQPLKSWRLRHYHSQHNGPNYTP